MAITFEQMEQHGAWTEEDWLALDESSRIELLDGALLMTPAPGFQHQLTVHNTVEQLRSVVPAGVAVAHELNLRLLTDRIVIPDVVVLRLPEDPPAVFDAKDVLLVGEVVSLSGAGIDRVLKPDLYAQAGIPWYLRIEAGPELLLHHLVDGSYVLVGRGWQDAPLQLPEPFDGDILPVDLLRQ